ncbi:MarR family winged helix-turn-helix transcriptional regulator [Chitinophaga sp. 22321]|uniref:MarR family transcriptional regulator n=1 Tax=Chitinophaga hostae TaxID=2831022 RepID=A0ABS5J445_9BACT|nr:MarR family transcriptional regulator [Chitinophaga hostae]MBS0029990.1 MarR family transcriptional regulator [Chitinophaga hostae]
MPADTTGQFEEAYTNLQCLIIAQVNKFSTEKLTATQYLVLDYIIRSGETATGQLAKQFRISAPAISRQIKKLMTDGLIIQKRDETDRRIYFNAVTPKAVKLVSQAKKLRKTMSLQIRHLLSESDRKTFIRICNRITNNIHLDE